MIAGALLLFRARPEPASFLDTLIVTISALSIVLEFLVLPSLEGYDGPGWACSPCSLSDRGRGARGGRLRSMLVGDMRRSGSAFLAGIGALIAADLLNLGIGLTDFNLDPSPTDGFWMLSMVLWAAASPTHRPRSARARARLAAHRTRAAADHDARPDAAAVEHCRARGPGWSAAADLAPRLGPDRLLGHVGPTSRCPWPAGPSTGFGGRANA